MNHLSDTVCFWASFWASVSWIFRIGPFMLFLLIGALLYFSLFFCFVLIGFLSVMLSTVLQFLFLFDEYLSF